MVGPSHCLKTVPISHYARPRNNRHDEIWLRPLTVGNFGDASPFVSEITDALILNHDRAWCRNGNPMAFPRGKTVPTAPTTIYVARTKDTIDP